MKGHKRTQEGVWGSGCGGGCDRGMAGFELVDYFLQNGPGTMGKSQFRGGAGLEN